MADPTTAARRKAMDQGGFGSIHDFTVGFDRGYEAAAPHRKALERITEPMPLDNGYASPEAMAAWVQRVMAAMDEARALLRREVGE